MMRSQFVTASQTKRNIQGNKGRLGNHDAQFNLIYDAIENLLDDKVGRLWENREIIGFKR